MSHPSRTPSNTRKNNNPPKRLGDPARAARTQPTTRYEDTDESDDSDPARYNYEEQSREPRRGRGRQTYTQRMSSVPPPPSSTITSPLLSSTSPSASGPPRSVVGMPDSGTPLRVTVSSTPRAPSPPVMVAGQVTSGATVSSSEQSTRSHAHEPTLTISLGNTTFVSPLPPVTQGLGLQVPYQAANPAVPMHGQFQPQPELVPPVPPVQVPVPPYGLMDMNAWQAITTLSNTVSNFIASQSARDAAVAAADTSSSTSSPDSEEVRASAKAKGLTRFSMITHYKVPTVSLSSTEQDHILAEWRAFYWAPLRQERNKVEVTALLKAAKLLLKAPISLPLQDALLVILSRAEELNHLEVEGSAYASIWASQVELRTEDNHGLASAHRTALLGSRLNNPRAASSRDGTNDQSSNNKRKRRRGSRGGNNKNRD